MAQERSGRVGRRLAAIMAADVAGYSRLMHDDEEGTHTRLTALLADIVEPAIAEYGGRVVKHTGDGFLAEFPSAVEAVRAARHFQDSIRNLTAGEAADRRLIFRVGINIGDVIVEAHDIFGDGVNIAARLEGIAEPGGICISSSAYDQVRGKLPIEVTDLGEQNLKNIARPVRAYSVVGTEPGSARSAGAAMQNSPSTLSIVVLPFTNMGGDPKQDYFVDGVTESLTTDLSRISGSFVIARNTAFTFKNKAVDVKKVGRELNVRYVLEGSVQRGGNRLRVNVQLIDAETGNHLWAERFDKPVADLFDMQDEIVSRLANELNAELVLAEAKRAERVLNPNVIELCFQGMAWIYKGPSRENMSRARDFFERALAVDPNCVEALLGMGRTEAALGATFIDEDRWTHFAAAEPLLAKVLALAPNNASAHTFLGLVQISTRRVEAGLAQCERALALDRNLANAWGIIAYGKQLLGYADQCVLHVKEAERLSPRDILAFRWWNNAGVAEVLLGKDVAAVNWFRRCVEANRNYSIAHFHLAAALALSGEVEEAQTVARTAMGLEPKFTIRNYRLGAASDNPIYLAGRERIYEGMRNAALPNG
ncbi:adenylate cyclase [Bradyrhizobium sp. CCBAU 11386]|nr:adenylate/guanylate cyclase domain-containing protein [Bradyrhizobium sp. CCBAU 11386]MDA9505293.1 adenylate cyclase [Bradyrhizobium sp. CCBAU 11386]